MKPRKVNPVNTGKFSVVIFRRVYVLDQYRAGGKSRRLKCSKEDNSVNDDIDFEDKELACADCGLRFTFTQDEQRFFWSKGLAEPKRCKPCRMLRRRSLMSIRRDDHNESNSSTT